MHDPQLDDGYGGIVAVYANRQFSFVGASAFRVGYHGVAPTDLISILAILGSQMTIDDIAGLDHTQPHTLWKAL